MRTREENKGLILDFIVPTDDVDIDESYWVIPNKFEWVDLATKVGNKKANEILNCNL